jgi:hypothetical protein
VHRSLVQGTSVHKKTSTRHDSDDLSNVSGVLGLIEGFRLSNVVDVDWRGIDEIFYAFLDSQDDVHRPPPPPPQSAPPPTQTTVQRDPLCIGPLWRPMGGPPLSTNFVAETERTRRGGSKPLIVVPIAMRQSNAARVFKAQLVALSPRRPAARRQRRVLRSPARGRSSHGHRRHPRRRLGFSTGGAVVLTRFNAQLKKGIIDIDAPPGHYTSVS